MSCMPGYNPPVASHTLIITDNPTILKTSHFIPNSNSYKYKIILNSNINFNLVNQGMALIIGHSHVKYFHEYLFDDSIATLSYSGSKIEELWPKIKDIVGNFKVIAVHTGANNIPPDGTTEVVNKMKALCYNILKANPRCHIVLSSILPRAPSQFKRSGHSNSHSMTDFLRKFNSIAKGANWTLSGYAQTRERITFVEFPRYVVKGEVQRDLLSKDGLHLSFEGTQYIVDTIEEQIFRTMWDMTKVKC